MSELLLIANLDGALFVNIAMVCRYALKSSPWNREKLDVTHEGLTASDTAASELVLIVDPSEASLVNMSNDDRCSL